MKVSVIQFASGESSLGWVLVAQSEEGICAVLLGDDRGALQRDLQDRFSNEALRDADGKLGFILAKVIEFVESPTRELEVPLDLRGTEFQREVWRALRKIPVGSTASYTDIAHQIGLPKGARAVAQACAANPLAVVIPCHRVVTSDGKLSGYRWGVERKKALLERERR